MSSTFPLKDRDRIIYLQKLFEEKHVTSTAILRTVRADYVRAEQELIQLGDKISDINKDMRISENELERLSVELNELSD